MNATLKLRLIGALIVLSSIPVWARDSQPHKYIASVGEGQSVKKCLKEIALIPDIEMLAVYEKNGLLKFKSTEDGLSQLQELNCIDEVVFAKFDPED